MSDLNSLQVGDVVVRSLKTPGITTHSLEKIEAINEKGIFINGCDEDFSDDSVYGYHFNGVAFYSFSPMMKSKIERKATEEDLIEFAED